jgi:hypothetical protein
MSSYEAIISYVNGSIFIKLGVVVRYFYYIMYVIHMRKYCDRACSRFLLTPLPKYEKALFGSNMSVCTCRIQGFVHRRTVASAFPVGSKLQNDNFLESGCNVQYILNLKNGMKL